ncbi:MAG: hypothetical protein ACREBR_04945 [bacterium]
MSEPNYLDIEIMLGLDDIAHNRLYSHDGGDFIPVSNYGKRNHKEKCYCKELRKLGVRR